MKIKLTQRGRFVVYSLLTVGVIAATAFTIFLVSTIANVDYDAQFKPQITCVPDTVLQPDGSCSPMER